MKKLLLVAGIFVLLSIFIFQNVDASYICAKCIVADCLSTCPSIPPWPGTVANTCLNSTTKIVSGVYYQSYISPCTPNPWGTAFMVDCENCAVNQICIGSAGSAYCCTVSCACASTTCYTSTCSNGCGGICQGTMQPNCPSANTVTCGYQINPINNCGSCSGTGTQCPSGQSCISGTCQSAIPQCSDYPYEWFSIIRPHTQCQGNLDLCVRDSGLTSGIYDQYCLSNEIYNITLN